MFAYKGELAMPKKKTALTIEERLQQALVPAEEQPYEVPENWVWVRLIGNVNSCLDGYRKPINSSERAKRVGKVPYYGATGQVGWIDDYLTNEHLVLLGEDGAPFLDLLKDKAYIIFGEAWVNNHAHILKSYFGEIGNVFLMHYLNMVDYKDYVKGTTRLKLTQGSMQLMPFPLPPLSEQQRIVERIEELFAKLDEAKERLQEGAYSFAVRKAAILHKAFTGELTKQWRRENGVSDESWEEVSLKELSSVIGDGLHGTPVYSENGDYYFINGNNFDDSFIAIKESTKRVSIEEYKKYAVNLNDNTVFLSINGTLGKTAFYNGEPVILGKSACYINVGEKLDKRFLKEMFHTNAFINYANQKATGSTIKNLGLKAIREYLVPLPSLPEQHEIVRLIDDLLARERAAQQAAEQALASIDLMKKSILARAFRGELGTNKASEASALELLKQVLAEN
ncbi:restriction endonuclease subunit S [Phascolarctobacterium succinatutens]|uniref:restriction endonuclease subunit S n=1 Tax=Phascolarctobacterium succinatutens TaxID=626940 RepID=UPI0023F7F296|nr:restriction endonuclease subunit S [Phascolarctobacterium succinatutens]